MMMAANLAFLLLTASPSAAPDTPASTSDTPCRIEAVSPPKLTQKELFLFCPDVSVRLGTSSSFNAAYNAKLGRFLVTNQTPSGEQVLLVKPGGQNDVLIEDLTADMGMAVKSQGERPPTSIKVDVTEFAASGRVSVTRATQGARTTDMVAPVKLHLTSDAAHLKVTRGE
ncbi:hypothetical protein SAMN05444678_12048 [Sphingomonas sp. YR710]|uniref:hypothetical protein n=1 Tax=Sphingomonas sp. YR710 TaxID=1882773 RepID=UPI00087EC2E4|nr:hypothetical protein [Sphingomonas sp. YR710]SDD72938.1 hypothetical protein SAMN05444678_12048 [Sphingomonas sp. YR710]